MCTLRGDRVESAKYYEGRVVALKSLRRQWQQQQQNSLDELIAQVSPHWMTGLPANANENPSWRSYTAGGQDLFDQLRLSSGR